MQKQQTFTKGSWLSTEIGQKQSINSSSAKLQNIIANLHKKDTSRQTQKTYGLSSINYLEFWGSLDQLPNANAAITYLIEKFGQNDIKYKDERVRLIYEGFQATLSTLIFFKQISLEKIKRVKKAFEDKLKKDENTEQATLR